MFSVPHSHLVVFTATSSWLVVVRTRTSWFRMVGRNLIITWPSMAWRLWQSVGESVLRKFSLLRNHLNKENHKKKKKQHNIPHFKVLDQISFCGLGWSGLHLLVVMEKVMKVLILNMGIDMRLNWVELQHLWFHYKVINEVTIIKNK